VGAILKATLAGGIEPAFRRTIGLNLDQLSDQWRDAVQKRYLPELGARARAKAVADALLTEKKSQGTLHLAPALSPDGSLVAYFTEKDFYSVDLWLADGHTGKPKHRILKSGISSNYETYRFINSQANWSPDGKLLAFAAKRGARDEIVVVDAAKNRPVDRIKLKLSGVTTPSWSPDGQQLVFTGYEGGFSDLFVVNRDGGGLRRLTEDKYADLHPVWSPDGKTIAFATDRGPETDFHTLAIGNFRIAQYDLATGNIRVLDKMDKGKNVSPQWAPDGRSIAFVSDRNGVSNIFLYDMEEHEVYQLTDFYTGAQGITPLSPVLSWAPKADRLAFVYYEAGKYDIYSLTNPRSLRRAPYRPAAVDSTSILAATPPIDTTPAATPATPPAASDKPAAVVNDCSTEIEGSDAMQFNVGSITVPASCTSFTITLKHTGTMPVAAMGHNVVIAQASDMQAVAADGMAAGAAAMYVKPGDTRVIAHSDIVGGGQSTSVSFDVGKIKDGGPYEFFCSFPGHSAMMKGTIAVG